MGMNTYLSEEELWPEKMPQSFINRVKETIQYLKTQDLDQLSIADCGEYNPMARQIENMLGRKISSINWNFNYMHIKDKWDGSYDVILCFEVLEHLFNPLTFLMNITRYLNKGGTIYLSTPYQRPQILKAIHHYHEIPTDRLMWLFEAAGLRVIECKKITIAGNWYNHIYGIRPILRYFQKTRLYKLKVI